MSSQGNAFQGDAFQDAVGAFDTPSGVLTPEVRLLDPLPLPTLPKKFIPPAATADNPPFRGIPAVVVVEDPPLPQRGVQIAPLLGAVVQGDIPFNRVWLNTVIDAWNVTGALLQNHLLSPGIPGQSVDDPPFSSRHVLDWLAYQPPDSLSTLTKKSTPPSVDNPPFSSRRLPDWSTFQPPDPLPTLTVKFTPSSVDNPPFTHRGRAAFTASIVSVSWVPPDPLPTLSGKLSPSVLTVRVDNPPFSSRNPWLISVVLQWQPPDPLPWVPFFKNASWNPTPTPPPASTDVEFFPFIANVGTLMRR